MGVLTVSLGKANEALHFFKIALNSISNIVQYWLSYIDALLNLGHSKEAQIAFQKKNWVSQLRSSLN